MQTRKMEISVGIFMIIALIAAIFLCLRVANVSALKSEPTYQLYARFDNIGGLKNHAPVRVGGVTIGRVSAISLDNKTYTPRITLDIDQRYNNIPDTSSLAVRTSGLLGEQYLALNIGFSDPELGTQILKNGDTVQDTKSAIVLEDLIGQFLYKNDNPATPDNNAGNPADGFSNTPLYNPATDNSNSAGAHPDAHPVKPTH